MSGTHRRKVSQHAPPTPNHIFPKISKHSPRVISFFKRCLFLVSPLLLVMDSLLHKCHFDFFHMSRGKNTILGTKSSTTSYSAIIRYHGNSFLAHRTVKFDNEAARK